MIRMNTAFTAAATAAFAPAAAFAGTVSFSAPRAAAS